MNCIDCRREIPPNMPFDICPDCHKKRNEIVKGLLEFERGTLRRRKNDAIMDLHQEKAKKEPNAFRIVRLAAIAATLELELAESEGMEKPNLVSALSLLLTAAQGLVGMGATA